LDPTASDRESGDVMLAVMKVLSNLDMAERRKKQTGKFGAKYNDHKYVCQIVSQGVKTGERVVLEANLKCRGMVIDSDTFFPGWTATIDGKSAPLYEAYGFLRGVVVEAGAHRIEMRYRPQSVYWGGAFTALGLAGAATLAAAKW
jgi:uncharacterized membrane protein YfhO